MEITKKEDKYRVAIVLCGMARLYQQGYQNIKKHILDSPKHKNIQFDFYLSAWNVNGDYNYTTKDFQANLNNNWVREDPIPENTLTDLTNLYQPKTPIKLTDYQKWKTESKEQLENFLKTHKLEDEPIRTFNGIFSQYYQVKQAFQLISDQKTPNQNTQPQYDLIIRTRYDLEFEDSTNFDINDFIKRTKTHPNPNNLIMEVESWDRNGIRGNFVSGTPLAMHKYSQLYDHLPTLTVDQVRETKLASIVFPKFVFNYILADGTYPDQQSKQEIFDKVKPYFYQKINAFLEKPAQRLHYAYSLIPEIFLKYYLQEIQHLDVQVIKNCEIKAINGQKNHPI